MEQAQFMVVEIVHEHLQNGAAGQAKEDHELHDRKATTRFLHLGLRKALLIGGGIGRLGGGAVHGLNWPTLQGLGLVGAGLGGLRGRPQSLFQMFPRHPLPGLDVSRIPLGHRDATGQAAQGLHVTDHFAAGGGGVEELPDETFDGEPQGKIPLSTVRAFFCAGQETGRQAVTQVLLALSQSALAKLVGGAAAEGGQARAQGWEEGRLHSCQYR